LTVFEGRSRSPFVSRGSDFLFNPPSRLFGPFYLLPFSPFVFFSLHFPFVFFELEIARVVLRHSSLVPARFSCLSCLHVPYPSPYRGTCDPSPLQVPRRSCLLSRPHQGVLLFFCGDRAPFLRRIVLLVPLRSFSWTCLPISFSAFNPFEGLFHIDGVVGAEGTTCWAPCRLPPFFSSYTVIQEGTPSSDKGSGPLTDRVFPGSEIICVLPPPF